MKRFIGVAILLSVAFGASALAVPTAAQTIPMPDNKQIDITYVEPTNINYRSIYDQLRKRRVLEQLKQFLAPLRLPENERLLIKVTDVEACVGLPNAWFDPRKRAISICYQFIDWYRRLAPRGTTEAGVKPADGVVGPFLHVLLHELGHALFHIYKVPIFGREEDAADQMAAFLLTQFGEEVARRSLLGAAHFYEVSGRIPEKTLFADTHGTDWQRYYNMLCIAYGGHPGTFQHLVDRGLLPKTRANGCTREHRQIAHAFETHISPHLDKELWKRVGTMEWLKPDDGTCIVERC